jgi:hypothetical protein
MKYKELESLYEAIKAKEKELSEVNYISRLHILQEFKRYELFDTLSEEMKRRLIETVYYYWIESIYPIEASEMMATIIMESEDSSFKLKLMNNALTVKEITKMILDNEDKIQEQNYC